MVGRRPRHGDLTVVCLLRRVGYGPCMPEIDDEVEEQKQNEVLKREGLEEELMQEGRSDEAENIAAVETGDENL